MENAVGKLDGVSSAAVNFMAAKLTIDAPEEKMEKIVAEARAIIKKIEPDVEVKAL
jgi:copper chaperone CopZ